MTELKLMASWVEDSSNPLQKKTAGQKNRIIKLSNPVGFDNTLRPQIFYADSFEIENFSMESAKIIQTDHAVRLKNSGDGNVEVTLQSRSRY